MKSVTLQIQNFIPMIKKTFPLLLIVLVLQACKKDDPPPFTPPPVFEHGVITSVLLTFSDTESSDEYTWFYSDPDGDGGAAPIVTADTLPANKSFTVQIKLFNETEDPVLDVTPEILDEADDHQFFFLVENNLELTMAYDDADSNGFPVGLSNTAQTGAPGSGSVTVILKHFPDKTGEGVAGGDITNAGGGTDAEVTFIGVIM